jgi:hypothetical protein
MRHWNLIISFLISACHILLNSWPYDHFLMLSFLERILVLIFSCYPPCISKTVPSFLAPPERSAWDLSAFLKLNYTCHSFLDTHSHSSLAIYSSNLPCSPSSFLFLKHTLSMDTSISCPNFQLAHHSKSSLHSTSFGKLLLLMSIYLEF